MIPRLLGRGEARGCRRADLDAAARAGGPAGDPRRAHAESALAAIRYADPASFTVATAVARAIAQHRDAVLDGADRVGLFAVSSDGPLEAIAAMTEASRQGSSSPIRFPASNAGSLAGFAGIALTLRGPTLMLTMPPADGLAVARTLAAALLSRGAALGLVLVACAHPAGEPAARAVLLGAPDLAGGPLVDDTDLAWVARLDEVPAADAPPRA